MGAKIDRDKLKSDLKAAGYKVTGEGLSKASDSSGSAVSDRINEMRNEFGTRQDKLIANNPAFVYAKVYGDGKTGQEANKPVKGKKITKPPKVQHRDGEIAALGAGDYGASNSTRFDKTMNAAIYSTAAALENLHGTLKEKDARQRARDEADSKRLKAGYDAMIQGEDIYSRPGGLKKISEDADKDFEARYEKVRGVGDE